MPDQTDNRPHSRACGITCLGHGKACSPDCPTCYGKEETKLKDRPEDQRLPAHNDSVDCQTTFVQRIAKDMPPRRQVGIDRYGTALQPFNKRDAMQDGWEEFLDLGVYMEQIRREREEMLSFIKMVAAGFHATTVSARARRLLVVMGVELR